MEEAEITDGYGNLQSFLICVLSVSSMAVTSGCHILELFLNYARVIILLESINCVKDTNDDCTSLYISKNISDYKEPRKVGLIRQLTALSFVNWINNLVLNIPSLVDCFYLQPDALFSDCYLAKNN